MIRLGFTESTLLFYYYLNKFNLVDNEAYKDCQNNLVNWLYSTSGFYDKTVKGTYFDFDTEHNKNTCLYNKYFEKVLRNLKNVNCKIDLNFHQMNEKVLPFKENFFKYINYQDKQSKYSNIFSFMANKKVLIINNLSPLMKQQFDSGNIHKICPEFPENIKGIVSFENGYSFFNNGPHENILQTYRSLKRKIQKLKFDCVIVSAGAYSSLLAYHISQKLKKDVFCCGGSLPDYFGIITKRTQLFNSNKINEYWVTVPEEMKPEGYMKIEDGCYW